MAVKKGGLGRGLDSLFNENSTEENGILKLNINDIEPNREQPRKIFDDDAVSELADSIAQHGLIQPIVVTPLSNGRYSIVAGERRWRACRMAGLYEVPVIVKDASGKSNTESSYDNKNNIPRTTENMYSRENWGYNKMTVDVVPFITAVYRNGSYNTNRAKSGAYPMLRGQVDNCIES